MSKVELIKQSSEQIYLDQLSNDFTKQNQKINSHKKISKETRWQN